MSKKVTWEAPVLRNMNSPLAKRPGQFGSFKEMWAKVQKQEVEQREAIDFMEKAKPGMLALLELKLTNSEPLVVMRPLEYITSELAKASDADDGFYANRSQQGENVKFQDVRKTILPGSVLILKSLDPHLECFIFMDGRGREHEISFSDRDKLMTQTDIFETVKAFIESRQR